MTAASQSLQKPRVTPVLSLEMIALLVGYVLGILVADLDKASHPPNKQHIGQRATSVPHVRTRTSQAMAGYLQSPIG